MREWVIQHIVTGQFLKVAADSQPEWWPDGTYRPRGSWVNDVHQATRFSNETSERLTSPPVSQWVPHEEAVAEQRLARAS